MSHILYYKILNKNRNQFLIKLTHDFLLFTEKWKNNINKNKFESH